MDVLLWCSITLPFLFNAFSLSKDKLHQRRLIYIYMVQMPWLVCKLLKNLGVFNLETLCAYKDERQIVFNKGHTQLQGTDYDNVMWQGAFFPAVCVSQSDRNRIQLRSGIVGVGGTDKPLLLDLITSREGTVLLKLFSLFSGGREIEIQSRHWILRAKILWAITSLERKNQKQMQSIGHGFSVCAKSYIPSWSRLLRRSLSHLVRMSGKDSHCNRERLPPWLSCSRQLCFCI